MSEEGMLCRYKEEAGGSGWVYVLRASFLSTVYPVVIPSWEF